MCVVDHAIADSVGDRRVGQHFVPMLCWYLAGDDCRHFIITIFEDLEQISSLGFIEGCDEEVVEDQDVGHCEFLEELGIRAIDSGDGELLEEPWDSCVQCPVVIPACCLG